MRIEIIPLEFLMIEGSTILVNGYLIDAQSFIKESLTDVKVVKNIDQVELYLLTQQTVNGQVYQLNASRGTIQWIENFTDANFSGEIGLNLPDLKNFGFAQLLPKCVLKIVGRKNGEVIASSTYDLNITSKSGPFI